MLAYIVKNLVFLTILTKTNRNMKKRLFISASIFLIICTGIFLYYARFPYSGKTNLRLRANNVPVILNEDSRPGHIIDKSNSVYITSIRKTAAIQPVPEVFLDAMLLLEETPNLIKNALLAQASEKKSYLFADTPKPVLAPLLPLDGVNGSALYGTMRDSEALDLEGIPLRWRSSSTLMAGLSPPKQWLVLPPVIPQKEKPPQIKYGKTASSYRALVENFARRFGLNTALVLAIIHSESNFSPSLVSNKSAMGLMQLLPSTASDEVHRFLYGRRGQIDFDDLRNPELNIHYGTAYLHILLTRYFPDVKDWEVREACVIASYNLGPNRFIKLYGANPEEAAEAINKMSPQEFFQDLPARLPVRETRNFVEKVRRMKNYYASLQ